MFESTRLQGSLAGHITRTGFGMLLETQNCRFLAPTSDTSERGRKERVQQTPDMIRTPWVILSGWWFGILKSWLMNIIQHITYITAVYNPVCPQQIAGGNNPWSLLSLLYSGEKDFQLQIIQGEPLPVTRRTITYTSRATYWGGMTEPPFASPEVPRDKSTYRSYNPTHS